MLEPNNGLPPETIPTSPTGINSSPIPGHDSLFPPLPKNSKRKTMHIDSFNAQNSVAPNTSIPILVISVPNSNEISGSPASSYKSTVQGFDDGASPMNDLSLADIDIESEDDADEAGDEEDEMCPRICLTKMEKTIIRKPWRHSIIIKMFDKNIGYLSLMRKLQAKWSIKGKLTLTDLTHSYYIARFSSKQDYDFVMTQGPWMIDDRYLTIRKWVPNFVPSEDNILKLTAWVHIPNLPVEYFNSTFLKKVGSKIGQVIHIDNNTATAQRGQFTQLSVEVDISKPLLSKFKLNGKVYGIQYEGLKMICFKCGKLGHTTEQCKKDESSKTVMEVEDQSDVHPDANAHIRANLLDAGLRPEESADFGEWMVVKKPPRRKQVISGKQATGPGNEGTIFNFGQSSKSSGSRFGILEINPEDPMAQSIPNQATDYAPKSGTGNMNKISAIKEVLRVYKPSVLALVETHMGGDHAIKLGSILGYTGHSRVNAIGFSGGIWLYWKTEVVIVSSVTEHPQYITVEVARIGEFPWFFSAVYASPDPTNRRELWNELETFARNNNRPWLIAGDFNETRYLSERHGGREYGKEM
ncbi:uncharacterized protein LOC141655633 [Silene latifolia]|uniref:uncharacterized protein LOC141655633 n=1 Tax=Silene latifolia TaxID=37657 RepID=UPI003D778697